MMEKRRAIPVFGALIGLCGLIGAVIVAFGPDRSFADAAPRAENGVSRAAASGAGTAETAVIAEPGAAIDPASAKAFRTLLVSNDRVEIAAARATIKNTWRPALLPYLIETANYSGSRLARDAALSLLREQTGADVSGDLNDWYFWLWNQPAAFTADYADFKADIYRFIDPAFELYFRDRQQTARIRLDEVRWGGVVQDGIPPLREPEMIAARKATYLKDDHVVFGIEVNGDARAYPKRILAWHEMFTDTVGGVDVAGVYCTLCGTVILYKTDHKGVQHRMGTSGFLYRSNKLMYDQATQSLWNTLTGEPVLGPLVDQGIALEHMSVVTTTWGEWRRRHPKTTVLSLKTGHRRDYGEGVAYQDYFATDRLMFNTPFRDDRLKNKQEVLALRFPGAPQDQLAIDTAFLDENPLYTDQVGTQAVLVLTDRSGANRVYDPAGVTFRSYDRDQTLVDEKGGEWRLTEAELIGPGGKKLERLPYHRAFWFGWRAAFPETRLVAAAETG